MTQKDYLTKVKQITEKANSKGLILEFDSERFDPEHLRCEWHGGNIATIQTPYKSYELTIDAIGDIYATLYDENNEEVAFCKDEQNCGRFYDDMHYDIKNDDDLSEKIESELLVFENNNWVEVDCLHEREDTSICQYDFIDWGFICDNVLDSINILDAIEEVIDRYDDEIKYWIEYEIRKEKEGE